MDSILKGQCHRVFSCSKLEAVCPGSSLRWADVLCHLALLLRRKYVLQVILGFAASDDDNLVTSFWSQALLVKEVDVFLLAAGVTEDETAWGCALFPRKLYI